VDERVLPGVEQRLERRRHVVDGVDGRRDFEVVLPDTGVAACGGGLVTIGSVRGRRFRDVHLRKQSMSGSCAYRTTGFPGWTPAGAELILSPYELVPARGL